MKTAVIYTRVSSEEQVSGTSLDTQLADCQSYAAAHGYTVAKVYTDAGISAKTANRPALQQAIVYCLKQHVSAFLVWKLDRLSRNTTDGLIIRQKLRNGGTEVLSATESIAKDAAGDLISSIILSVAQYDNTLRATRCRRGMEETALRGGWVWKAPLGFDLVKRDDGLPILTPNDTGRVIQAALKGLAAGTVTKSSYYATLESIGIDRRRANMIPLREIYAGIIRSDLTGGQPVKAAFGGLITETERQAILSQRRRTVNRRATRGADYREVLTCAVCGRPLTAYTSKNHLYYKCPDSHVNARAEGIVEQIQDNINRVPVMARLLEKVVAEIRKRTKQHQDKLRERRAIQASRATAAQRRLDALIDAHLDGTIDAQTYARKSAEYRSIIASANTQKTDTTLEVNKSLTNFERTLERLRDPATLLDTIPEEKRAALIRLIFGGFTVSKDKSIAVSSNFSSGNLLAALRDIKTTTYNEKEAPERTSDSASSFMVERRGFEPLTPTLRT